MTTSHVKCVCQREDHPDSGLLPSFPPASESICSMPDAGADSFDESGTSGSLGNFQASEGNLGLLRHMPVDQLWPPVRDSYNESTPSSVAHRLKDRVKY